MTLREFIFGEFDGAIRDKKRPNGSDSGLSRRTCNALYWLNYDEINGKWVQCTDAEHRIIKELPNLMEHKNFGQASYNFIIQRLHTVFRSFNDERKEK